MQNNRSDLIPSIGLAFGAMMWGLYWIPIRGIEAAGVGAYWTGPVIFGASALLFLPFVLFRWHVFAHNWRRILLPGILAGLAFALYIASLNLTELVRAILLFYISPVWSTVLGILILNEKLTVNRVVGLFLAFAGLYVVLAAGGELPIPRNSGDWYALVSGMCWSVASVKLFQDGASMIVEKVAIFIFFALIVSLLLVFGAQGDWSGMPDLASLLSGWYWIVIIALSMLPICYLTIWPATLLSPGRVGMLLMGEVIVGIGSAAYLSGEVFGWRELVGTLLIVSAAIVEVARQQTIEPVIPAPEL